MPQWTLAPCMAAFLVGAALAQTSGSLSGSVQDFQGKPVAGARVTVAIMESQVVFSSADTSLAGAFSFHALRPALYALAVEAPGFERKTVENVRIYPGAETSLSVRLAPANASPLLTVKAPDPSQTGTAVAAVVNAEQAGSLPLPGRESSYLLDLLPGVQRNGRAPLSMYGESASLGAIIYDGINVQKSFPRLNGVSFAASPLHADQVAEAFVVTGAISGCGCVQAGFTAPAGSSALHGSAYWLLLPSSTAAQYWLDNSRGAPSRRSMNELGASFGGALMHSRLFYFGSYEGALDHSAITRTGAAPTRPLTSRDPLMQQVLALIPSDPTGTYRGWQNNGGDFRSGLARLDYAASSSHRFGLTFLGSNSSTDDPFDSSVFGRRPATTIGLASRTFAASWRWSPSARLTNELRAGGALSRFSIENSLRSQFDFIAILRDPQVAVSQPMAGLDPQEREDHQLSLQDDLTWTAGKHSASAGFWLQRYRLLSEGVDNGLLDSGAVPRYVVADISEGAVSSASQRFNLASAGSGYSGGAPVGSVLSTKMISGYLHDAWKPLPPLTLSLGMRFDWLAPAQVRRGAAIIPVLPGDAPSDSVYDKALPFTFASTPAFYRNDLTNYALYVGLAWKPAKTLPLVVRGSAHLSTLNDNLLQNMSFLALQNPFQNFDVAADLSAGPASLSGKPAVSAPAAPANWTLPSLQALANSYGQQPRAVYGINPNLATPNIKYWNVGVEGELKGFALDVRYLGNLLEEGARSVDRNQVMLRNGFLEEFGQVRSDLQNGVPTAGFTRMRGGGLCANFSLQNCRPDLYARSLIQTGQAGELARWYEGQGYDPGVYNLLGNPLAPGGINLLSHMGVSRFDALQVAVSRNIGSGVNLQASYLYSKVMSNLNDYRPGAVDPYLDVNNSSLEWAPSPFNLRHAFKAAFVEELPFFRSGSARTLPGRLLSRWTVACTVIAQSGAPFSLLSGGYVTMPGGDVVAVSGLGTLTSQADSGQNTVFTSLNGGQIRQLFGIRKGADGAVSYVNAPADAFQQPAPGALGNLQRRMFSGPGAVNLNLGLHKSIPLNERLRAEFRAESINLLNRVNWLVRDQVLLGTGNRKNAAFNNDVTQWNSPRSLQFSLRLVF
jgi:hypothetical protein